MNNSRGKVCTQDNDYGFLTGHPSHPGHRQRKLLAPHSDVVMSSAVRGSPDGSVTVTTLPRRNAHQNVKVCNVTKVLSYFEHSSYSMVTYIGLKLKFLKTGYEK